MNHRHAVSTHARPRLQREREQLKLWPDRFRKGVACPWGRCDIVVYERVSDSEYASEYQGKYELCFDCTTLREGAERKVVVTLVENWMSRKTARNYVATFTTDPEELLKFLRQMTTVRVPTKEEKGAEQ